MSTEILPIEVGDQATSRICEAHGGTFMTFNLSGMVTGGYIEIQTSWDKFDGSAWRPLIEDSVPKRLDANNSNVRVRGPIVCRAVRNGSDAIGCTVSNLNGNRDL